MQRPSSSGSGRYDVLYHTEHSVPNPISQWGRAAPSHIETQNKPQPPRSHAFPLSTTQPNLEKRKNPPVTVALSFFAGAFKQVPCGPRWKTSEGQTTMISEGLSLFFFFFGIVYHGLEEKKEKYGQRVFG